MIENSWITNLLKSRFDYTLRAETFAIFAILAFFRESYFRKNKTFNKNRESFLSVLKVEKPKIKKGLL